LLLSNYTAGMHNITASKETYENGTLLVDFSRQTSVLIKLTDKAETIPADAMVIRAREDTPAQNSIPGASVYIDGALAGETDNYGIFWTENNTGTHTVKVTKKNSVDTMVSVDFTPGGSHTILLQRVEKKYSIFDSELFFYAVSKEMALGLVATLKLSLIAFAAGICIGLIMGLGRVSSNRLVRYAASVYVEGVRGLPLVLQILFVYYGMPFFVKDMLGIPLIINEFYAAVIALSLNSGAYMAEIFKAGIEAIHKGQMEAARSVGISYWQAMMFVILPQAFKIVLPALGNEFIALIKDSSISLVISYQELTYWAKSVGYEYYNAFTPLVAAGCLYLLITIPLGKLVQYIEKRYSTSSPRKEGAGWLGKRRKAGGNEGPKEGTA
jgi:polar amino acid transport system permease protein